MNLSALLADAEEFKTLVKVSGGDDRLKHRILGTVFYEVRKDDVVQQKRKIIFCSADLKLFFSTRVKSS